MVEARDSSEDFSEEAHTPELKKQLSSMSANYDDFVEN